MRAVRMRVLAICGVLVIAGVGGWQLLPEEEEARRLDVGTTDAVTTLDPAGAYNSGSWALFNNLYQSLMTFDPNGTTPVPDAARRCGFVGDGMKTYRCVLRDDLKFPSGRAVTGEDVKYSIDRVKTIKSKSGVYILFTNIKSVEADGLKVTFHLKDADATFPLRIATGPGSIVDREKYPADALRESDEVDGTGPYTLKSFKKGEIAELEPYADYKGTARKAGQPVSLRYFKDSAALNTAWKRKEVDVAARQMPPSAIVGVSSRDRKTQITETSSAEIRNMVLNLKGSSPFSRHEVRQAAAWLIDRGQLSSEVYRNTVDPLYSLIPQGITGHRTPFFDKYPRPNVDEAKALLRRAGVRLPVRFELAYSQGSATKEESALLKEQLERGGLFEVKTRYYEWEQFQDKYTGGKFDAYTVGWVPDYPDPDTFVPSLVGTENSLFNGYSSKVVDRLVADTQQFSERSRAADAFEEVQRVVAEDVPLIPLWQRKEYLLSTSDVSGAQYVTDGTGIFRLWELDWI